MQDEIAIAPASQRRTVPVRPTIPGKYICLHFLYKQIKNAG